VSTHAAAAHASSRAAGVPASIILAQAALESGWGKRATTGHNFFGIKGSGPAGSTTEKTREFVNGKWVKTTAEFRAYHDAAESFTDHGRFLAENPRYAEALRHAHDPVRFAEELQKARYATDPNYAEKLIAIIRKHNLTQYDLPAPAPSPGGP
jgi:flagellum-specific peptidoglycan hydrolase FlgJ